eukprot:jgi/Botrbrau1/11185/Bobra.0214s0011.1
MNAGILRPPVQSFEATIHLAEREFPVVSRRRAGNRAGLGHPCIALLLLLLASENVVEGRRRVERRDVVKGVHIDAVPWAKGRQSEPGVGRYWRRLHGNFIKEIKRADDNKTAFDIIFFGDSIVEAWRGTYLGSSWTTFKNVPMLWAEAFAKKVQGGCPRHWRGPSRNPDVPAPDWRVASSGPPSDGLSDWELRPVRLYMHRRCGDKDSAAPGLPPHSCAPGPPAQPHRRLGDPTQRGSLAQYVHSSH